MSIDRRLREGLEHLSGDTDTSLDTELERVMKRGRRKRALARGATAISIAASLVVVGVFGPKLLDDVRRSDNSPAHKPVPPLSAIAGTYAAALPSGGEGVIGRNDMGGTWTLTLEADGTLELDAPVSFGDVATGYGYELARNATFTTNVFVNDQCGDQGAGTYAWRLSGERLTFTVVGDSCALREALLTTPLWTSD